MKPAIGACTESAMSRSRASSPNAVGEVVVHPEAALEVDLAGRVGRARRSGLDRRLRRLPRGHARRAEMQWRGTSDAPLSLETAPRRGHDGQSVRPGFYPVGMPEPLAGSTCSSSTSTCGSSTCGVRPPGISEWSLEVVAAFMRAAYGKGYCDALTEEAPGSLCADHGYRVPAPAPRAPTPDR